MKAWRVDDGDEWCVLIMAATRSRAKMIFKNNGPAYYNMDYQWTDIRAIRHPDLDGMIDHEKMYDDPSDLPDGVTFWRDDFDEGEL